MKKTFNLFKSTVCICLVLALVLLLICSCSPTEEEKEFVPVLRFAIASDVHVRSTSDDYGSAAKLSGFIDSAYRYAESEASYRSLDGIFIVGDLTQDGKTAEYDIAIDIFNRMVDDDTVLRVAMGNHEFHAYGSGDERFTAENIAKSTARFKAKLGYESEDMHLNISGYHFIIMANDSYESRNYYDAESLEWLENEIKAAMADDTASDKPIFVMQHEPPRSEVRGFTGGDTELGELLKKYPRVVDFSGHTHRSILDPQSIWQDGFTAIGTGGLAYLGYNMAGHPTRDNSSVVAIDEDGGFVGTGSTGTRTGAMYYIVEVDAGNNIRLRIYDLLTDSLYGEPIIFKVGADAEKVFTPEREAASVAPTFGDGAGIEMVSDDYDLPIFKFPTPTGGDLTQYYRIELWDGGDEPALVTYRLGCMHNAAKMPEYFTVKLRGHSHSGAYTVKVYAVNCWGKESEPVVGSITIAESTLEPDILNTVFGENGKASNADTELPSVGNASTAYNEELERFVASFNGNSGYKFDDIDSFYSGMVYSLTYETLFKVGEGVEESVAIGANNNSSGFGLARRADGSLRFAYGYNNGAKRYVYATTAEGIAEVGEWVYAVIVFDGEKIKVYVNGEAVTLYNEDGKEIGDSISFSGKLFDAPKDKVSVFYVGADVSSSGGMESGFVGDIAVMNLYSRPLTEDEVGTLYGEYSDAIE